MKRFDGYATWIGLLALAGILVAACPSPEDTPADEVPGASGQATILDPDLVWHGDTRARLEEMIASRGSSSPDYDPGNRPVAIFDWDNTVIKNDIGDGYLSWMLLNDKIRQPPGKDWSSVSQWLTPEALRWLGEACGEHPEGEPMPTHADEDCASAVFGVYEEGRTADGSPAFRTDGYDRRAFVPSLAFVAQIQAGYTLDELDGFADEAIELYLSSELGSRRTVGQHDTVGWIRIYEHSRALIGALQDHGFDVWIVSASPEPPVRAFARKVRVDADHVIGIRSVVGEDAKFTYDLRGCGSVADGDNTIVTFVDGKRCFVNQEIFGVEGPAAMDVQADPAKRPTFVAGDATTDVSMLRDATALRLVVNRQRGEVMCHAYHDADGRWLVNPMYIEPLDRRAEPYPCSTTACMDATGADVPCLDDDGAVIPDQEDTVFVAAADPS